jgi:hypothetical protein
MDANRTTDLAGSVSNVTRVAFSVTELNPM